MKVYWAGWQSDTHRLQREGWQLSADQDIRMQAIRIAMKHEGLRCVAVSQMLEDFRYEGYARDYSASEMPPLVIQFFACRLEVVQMPRLECMNFSAIDAAPQFLSKRTIHSYEDLKWFAAPLVETKELIVDPAKIGDILAQIAQAQVPEQEAIRKRAALRANREGMELSASPRREFHAQVLSIAA